MVLSGYTRIAWPRILHWSRTSQDMNGTLPKYIFFEFRIEDLGRTPGFLGWIFWTIIFYYWLSWCKIIKVFRPVFCPFLKMSLHWSTHKQERYKGPTLTIQRGECVPILKISGSVTIFTLHYTLWPYNLESNIYKSGTKKTVRREGIEPIEGVFTYVLFSVTHSL